MIKTASCARGLHTLQLRTRAPSDRKWTLWTNRQHHWAGSACSCQIVCVPRILLLSRARFDASRKQLSAESLCCLSSTSIVSPRRGWNHCQCSRLSQATYTNGFGANFLGVLPGSPYLLNGVDVAIWGPVSFNWPFRA